MEYVGGQTWPPAGVGQQLAARVERYNRLLFLDGLREYAERIRAHRDVVHVVPFTVLRIASDLSSDTATLVDGWAEHGAEFVHCLLWPGCFVTPGDAALAVVPPDDVVFVVPADASQWSWVPFADLLAGPPGVRTLG